MKIFAANRAAAMLNRDGLNLFVAIGGDCTDRLGKADPPLQDLLGNLKREFKIFTDAIAVNGDGVPMTFFQWNDLELLRSLLTAETLPNTPESVAWSVDVLSSGEYALLTGRPSAFCGETGQLYTEPIPYDFPHVDFVYSLFQPEGRDDKKAVRVQLGCAASYMPAADAPANTAAIPGLVSGASPWLGVDGTSEGTPSRDPSVNGSRIGEDDFVSRVVGMRLVLRPKEEVSGQ